jgi:hypothetical protein
MSKPKKNCMGGDDGRLVCVVEYKKPRSGICPVADDIINRKAKKTDCVFYEIKREKD